MAEDTRSEMAVLAGLVRHGSNCYGDISELSITPATFSDNVNAVLFRCLEHVLKDGQCEQVDYPALMSAAHSLGLQDILLRPDDSAYVNSVFRFGVREDTVPPLAKKIRKLEAARTLANELRCAAGRLDGVTGEESWDSIMSQAEEPVFDLTSRLAGGQGMTLMGHKAVEYANHLFDNPRKMIGVSTGMPMLDLAWGGGVRPNSMNVIVCRSGGGKTTIGDNVGIYMAEKLGIPVCNIDTEMSLEEHQNRIFSLMSGVQIWDIETGELGPSRLNRRQVVEAAERLEKLPYHYECVIGKKADEVMASIRRWVVRKVGLDDNGKARQPCVLIYDYLKMLDAEFMKTNAGEHQALGFLAMQIKNLAGRYGMGTICFGQTNRDGVDKEDVTIVAGSDRIVHYCTSLTIYKEKNAEEMANSHPDEREFNFKLIPLKSRWGGSMPRGDYINVRTDYSRSRVSQGPTRSQLEARRAVVLNQGEVE